MARSWKVYALSDPRDGERVCIGCTVSPVEKRFGIELHVPKSKSAA